MITNRLLEQIWTPLRSQKPSRENSLEEVVIRGLRGIRDLRIPLPFPVSVLAGPNGCGKSTVLFALACAYRQPKEESRLFTPAILFPDFRPSQAHIEAGEPSDSRGAVELGFSYVASNERVSMRWVRRGKGKWNRGFYGRKRGTQPERELYLRTLANLSNPSEIRSVLQMSRKEFKTVPVDASNIAFAQSILSYRYAKLSRITSGLREVLFAERQIDEQDTNGASYSEFHMSAGERAVLRLSISISKLRDALVLIDEVETGLHPYVQQMLMLELQRLALRNQLQIIVTTHSPIVLNMVPPDARIFLERGSDNVDRLEPYQDIIERSLYGRSQNVISFLCEDEESESFVRGVLEYLSPKIDLLQNDIRVGRDTGKDQFPHHLDSLGKFGRLRDIVFVLDGDGREVGPKLQARAEQLGQSVNIVYLPGIACPEQWVWDLMKKDTSKYAEVFSLAALSDRIRKIENIYAHAIDKPSEIAKNRLYTLASEMARDTAWIMRMVGKHEAETGRGEVFELVNQIQDMITQWRAVGL